MEELEKRSMTETLYSKDNLGRFVKGTYQGIDSANPNWKGDDASVYAIHGWIIRHYGSPRLCEKCGTIDAKRYDWANISGDYKRSRLDFIRLCSSCHVKMDKNWVKKTQTNYKYYSPSVNNICIKCKSSFISKDKDRKFCSKTCWYERNKYGR